MQQIESDGGSAKEVDANLGKVTPNIAMQTFIVSRNLDTEPVGPSRSRETVISENKRKGAEFLKKLIEFLDREELRSETGRINNLTNISALIIECTPRVAERLKSFEGVASVIDNQRVELIKPVKGRAVSL